jgi:tRNA pseudouridine13 synthase
MSPELFAGDPTTSLPRAHGVAPLNGRLRARPEHFIVDEQLPYGPDGSGEHAWLRIRKRERNTHDVARLLARHAGVAQVAVGYAGLKDRNAVTTQHFTVHLPGREDPDWSGLEADGIEIVDVDRHSRKIRRGSLKANRFELTVTQCSGARDEAERKLAIIAASGVPNYFGPQRFGREGNNLQRADALFAGTGKRPGREQKGLLLSAARSQLFNAVLAERVKRGDWNTALPGDVLLFEGSQRQFRFDSDDPTIPERILTKTIHPSGPLPGRACRSLEPLGDVAVMEAAVLAPWGSWVDGLQRFGLDADRRALRLVVNDLAWEWRDDSLVTRFSLPSGTYATSVLRELLLEQ